MITALLKGLFLGLMLMISVGPVIFSIIKHSLNNGHKGGIAFVLGVSASDITIVVLSNAFTEVFDSIKRYANELGIVGSCFLAALGIYFLFFKKIQTEEESVQLTIFRKRDYARIFLSGFFMNSLNPGVLLFWFVTASATATMTLTDKIILFSTCLVMVLAADLAKVFLANRIRPRLTRHNIHLINRISGLILIGFGVALLYGILFLHPVH
ncbi:LysE family translocator [Dinghuibacter silviterrae]|uniref:Threonine/homoserine/homoserine lactone efflux protein n=1 Tax=Dinghuibacter silviterrae TaxID=1539049 RepID=A0A4R8DR29_9BACT|nr:LysE family transporter [Dinghuibacter silviterrae]TDW99580.1 threonine/homoserine/homoserine lactone efflux protein [Dinghuibacter silviterrae]